MGCTHGTALPVEGPQGFLPGVQPNSVEVVGPRDAEFQHRVSLISQNIQSLKGLRGCTSATQKLVIQKLTLELEELLETSDGIDDATKKESVLRKCWEILNGQAGGEIFYQNLFEDAPSLIKGGPFHGVDMRVQAQRLMDMLGFAIKVVRTPDVIIPKLSALGARHQLYGTRPEHYEDLGVALMKTLKQCLGENFTADVQKHWQETYVLITTVMLQGAASDEGHANAAKYAEFCSDLIKNSWAKAKLNAVQSGQTLVAVLLEKCQHPMRNTLELQNTIQDKLDKIVQVHREPDELRTTLLKLGVQSDAYGKVFGVLQSTLQTFLGSEFTSRVEAQWIELGDTIQHVMQEVMQKGKDAVGNRHAPRATPLTLMFTDIEQSTRLWEVNHDAMVEAIGLHNVLVRRLAEQHEVYEVKIIGDAFMLASTDIVNMTVLATRLQMELVTAHWPPTLKPVDGYKGTGPSEVWSPSGLRVRSAIHYCTHVTATFDSVHQRFDYFGSDANVCARLESCACGGQVVMTIETQQRLMSDPKFDEPQVGLHGKSLKDVLVIRPFAYAVYLKGISQPVNLVTALPFMLAARRFQYQRKQQAGPAEWGGGDLSVQDVLTSSNDVSSELTEVS